MKRFLSIALAALGAFACIYIFLHWDDFAFRAAHANLSFPQNPATDSAGSARAPRIDWQAVDRPGDGFRLEMPSDQRQIQVPAYNEAGISEPVNMLLSGPDANTAFAVAWSDDPPAMRMVNRAPDRTLDVARDGLLARTQTALVSETRCSPQGFPGRDILARNVGGGVLDARLIVAGQRLYMLTVAYPSMAARREQDVRRFVNSFAVSAPAAIPSSLPSAPAPAERR